MLKPFIVKFYFSDRTVSRGNVFAHTSWGAVKKGLSIPEIALKRNPIRAIFVKEDK